MKFATAFTALVASMAVGAEAGMPKNKRQFKKELNRRMKNGQFDAATLMRGAKPHNEAAKRRKLDDDMQVTSANSIQFVSCFSLTTSYEDLFDGDDNDGQLQTLYSQGQVMAMESYAIFRLCNNGSCNYNNYMEYVIDLNTYVAALVNYLPTQMENYCEGCKENQDSCYNQNYGGNQYDGQQYGGQYGGNYNNGNNANQNQDENRNENDNAYKYQQYNAYDNNYNGAQVNNVNYSGQYGQYNNGNNRKLAELHEFESRVLQGQVVRELDCDLCVEYSCFEEEEGGNNNNNQQNDYNFEDASEWLTEMSQCVDLEASYNPYGYQNGNNGGGDDDNNIFAGLVCNGDGTGVEIGLFMDEDCHLYLTNEAYSNYMSYSDQTYAQMTKEIVEFTFSSAVFTCNDEDVVYTTNLQNYYANNGYNNNNNNGEEDEGEVSEWCEQLFEGDNENEAVPIEMATCGAYAQYGGNGYYDGGQNWQDKYDSYMNQDEQNQYMYMYDWYRFEISEDDAYDMQAVCKVVRKSGGELHTFYNSANGNIYDYSNGASDNISEFMDDTSNSIFFGSDKLSGGAKFGIVVLIGLISGAGVALYLRFKSTVVDDKNVGLMEDVPEQKGEVA